MSLLSIFITALALSMDAFAVSLSIGMSCDNCSQLPNALKASGFFGGFQGLMPLIGYFISFKLAGFVGNYDGLIAFIILGFLGGKMIFEALKRKEESNVKCYSSGAFLTLAIATSIDALAVGVSFAMLDINIIVASIIIAITTGIISFIGVKLGKFVAKFIGNKAELIGGGVLIIIGLKILLF